MLSYFFRRIWSPFVWSSVATTYFDGNRHSIEQKQRAPSSIDGFVDPLDQWIQLDKWIGLDRRDGSKRKSVKWKKMWLEFLFEDSNAVLGEKPTSFEKKGETCRPSKLTDSFVIVEVFSPILKNEMKEDWLILMTGGSLVWRKSFEESTENLIDFETRDSKIGETISCRQSRWKRASTIRSDSHLDLETKTVKKGTWWKGNRRKILF